MLLSVKMQGK